MTLQDRRRVRGGFTLLEVMLVLMILGLLATVAVFTLGGQSENAKLKAATIQVNKIDQTLSTYSLNLGLPTEEQGGLQALVTKPQFDDEEKEKQWAGPYLKSKELKDPWDQDLNYEVLDPSEYEQYGGAKFKLWSNGPDKQSDTDDDIRNWSTEEAGI